MVIFVTSLCHGILPEGKRFICVCIHCITRSPLDGNYVLLAIILYWLLFYFIAASLYNFYQLLYFSLRKKRILKAIVKSVSEGIDEDNPPPVFFKCFLYAAHFF